MILDGNSIVNRAFFGIRMLNAPDGTPTNGVYGFLAILQRLLEQEKPEALCVAFDLKAPTFRHEKFAQYKAQRKPMPEELAAQMPVLKEVLDAMGVKRCEQEGFEADDLIGAVAKRCAETGWECCIVTGDRDSFQLISDSVYVNHIKTRLGQTETVRYDLARFCEEYGFAPPRMVDLKALMGDSSDGIPGVPGVGVKTAMELMHRFGSLDGVYAHLDDPSIRESVRKKLEEGRESARLSFELATIDTDVPLCFEPEDAVWKPAFGSALYDTFQRLGFTRFIEKWGLQPDQNKSSLDNQALPAIEVSDEETMKALCRALRVAEYIAVLPLDGLNALEICDGAAVYSVRWASAGGDYNALLRLAFSSEVKKVSHGVKELCALLLADGLPAEGFVFDTALAAYLLEATESRYEPSPLAAKYLKRASDGAAAVYGLYPAMDQKLLELDMRRLYYEIELPLCTVLAEMERAGFAVDKKALRAFGLTLDEGIRAAQNEIFELAGGEFNINSPKQLGEVLFDKLMLPTDKKTKTGWSTNADVLEKLRGKHPVIQAILDYRQLTKLKSTYVDGLLKVISPDGRIHTSFQMTVTATGRLSSTEPNLQNIPVRTPLGAELRKMFAAGPGRLLVDADYSQIELRLLAHISKDETMKNAFRSGEDIHRVTASQVFNVPLEEVTPLQRSRAKAVNFGIVYGISAFSLAQDIGVWQSEAKEYIDAYLAKYHGVRDYMERVVSDARRDGFVSTLFRRRRYLPELKAANYTVRSFGERVARNMPIQGTAADIIKLAMVNVRNRLKAEGLASQLILQVHDELIAECPEEEAERVRVLLQEEMENAFADCDVPLTAEAKIGKSWAEAH
jgi:DNA polymerase-1